MDNEHFNGFIKLGNALSSRPDAKVPPDKIKLIIITILAAIIVILIMVAVAYVWGVKLPSYSQGYVAGYRASYPAGYDGTTYNVKAGFGQDNYYNDGYRKGYDDGYPDGQLDRNRQILSNNTTSSETSDINSNSTDNVTINTTSKMNVTNNTKKIIHWYD